jgi:hypothetical protein
MSFQPPFEQLQLSNSASTRNGKAIPRNGIVFDNWRATLYAFRTFLSGKPELLVSSNCGDGFHLNDFGIATEG